MVLKVLVLGGTGPAGICLLRELVHRNHETVIYCRNPMKIPSELTSSPLIETIQGELDNLTSLSMAIAKSDRIISLLGPNTLLLPSQTFFADFYTNSLFPLSEKHKIKSIYAMGTLSISQPELDIRSLKREAIVGLVWVVANIAYRNIIAVGKAFEEWKQEENKLVKWTVFRIAAIPGGAREEDWIADRESGDVFIGGIGEKGWTTSIKRARLARFLVDFGVEDQGQGKWVGKMPAVSEMGKL